MKIFKDKIDNFFKWVKGAELVELTNIDVSEDPNHIEAVVCVAFTNEVPTTVKELDYMSQVACQDNQSGKIAVAYTVWSRKRGAGKEIINKLLEFVKEKPYIERLVTLSPLTTMASHFHMKNGAKLISINPTTQNFEYQWSVH